MNEKYIYYCTRRPAAPGTIPTKNLLDIENFSERQQFAFCKAWSRVTYSEPLTPETLRQYELAENKPEPDEYITLKKVNALVYFHGTEAEQNREDLKERRNEILLRNLYEAIEAEHLQALYFKHKPNPDNGRQLVYILHRSAKYNRLQFTCVMFENDEFLYMCGDHEVIDFTDFLQEANFAGMNGSNVYYF
jgi:hypothetical protein